MELDINEIIIRYLGESITNDERISLFHWLKQSEANRTYFQEVRNLWLACNAQYASDLDTEIALARFRKRVRLLKLPSQPNTIWKRKVSVYHLIWAVAASILLLIGYTHFFKEEKTINQPVLNHLFVAEGSNGRFVLPDSSIVWLNGGSSLQYKGDLSGTQREISLEGEGYFEVTKREHSPFIVEVGAIQVKVLGTRFNIDGLHEKNEIRIALLQGAIEILSRKNQPIALAPKDMACYNMATGQTTIVPNATENVLYWIDKRLVFKGETFEQIVQILEHNFNVQVKIHNEKIKNQRFVGDFVNNESIGQIFAIMSADGNFHYQINGNVVDIY